MTRRLILIAVAAVLAAAMALAATATPAEARKLIGCNSLLEWPCPGPAL